MVAQVAILAFGSAAIWPVLALLATHQEHARGADAAGAYALFLSFAALSFFVGVRALRSGLWITTDEVIIRGFCKSHRFPLAEVSSFVADDPGATWPFVARQRRRAIAVTPLSPSTWRGRALGADFPSRLRPTCEQLNALLLSVRATAAPAIHPPADVGDFHREYHPIRNAILAFTAVVWIIAALIAVSLHTVPGDIFAGGIALLDTASTVLALHLVKKNITELVPRRPVLPARLHTDRAARPSRHAARHTRP